MLVGGSAQWYLKYIYKDENCELFTYLIKYQVHLVEEFLKQEELGLEGKREKLEQK